MIKNLVISGGGISGMGLLGIIKYLEDNNFLTNIESYIGTSVGSIICFLLSIGYKSKDLYNFSLFFDFSKLVNDISLDSFLQNWGLTNTERLSFFLKRLIENKKYDSNITFKELYEKTKINLIITGTCLNESKVYYFNYKTYPNMNILQAILISSCIPLLFEPIKFENKFWADGGIIDNYPIKYFKDNLKNTLGLCIFDKCFEDCCENKINDIKDYLVNTFKCILYGACNSDVEIYKNNTIKFSHFYEGNFKFDMNKKSKENYFNLGYKCAEKQDHILDQFRIDKK